MLLSFACKKKPSQSEEQQPATTTGPAQSNERTVSILFRPQGTDNVLKVTWDYNLNGNPVDSVYVVPHAGLTFTKKIPYDSIRIMPISRNVSGGSLLNCSITVTSDGKKIKDTANVALYLMLNIK